MNSKQLCVVFTTSHSDTLGNACRLAMIEYLSHCFDTTIITNKKEFLSKQLPACTIIEYVHEPTILPSFIANIFEWQKIARQIKQLRKDFVFMFDDTSPVSLCLNQPVFQYVHQYGVRSDQDLPYPKKLFSTLVSAINDKLKILGLIRSNATFAVSKPIIEILGNKGVQVLIHTPHGVKLSKFLNPVLSDFHKPLARLKQQGYFLVCYAGWVTDNRGFRLMLDSIRYASSHDKKIALIIAGADRAYSHKIAAYTETYHLHENIHDLGTVDSSLIPGILHYSDVCLSFLDDVPAYRISPPQKVIEYFAAGKPVICNKIPTHELLVNHNENGFIIDADPYEISEAICKLKNDRLLYKALAQNALHTANLYDIDTIYGGMVRQIVERLNET